MSCRCVDGGLVVSHRGRWLCSDGLRCRYSAGRMAPAHGTWPGGGEPVPVFRGRSAGLHAGLFRRRLRGRSGRLGRGRRRGMLARLGCRRCGGRPRTLPGWVAVAWLSPAERPRSEWWPPCSRRAAPCRASPASPEPARAALRLVWQARFGPAPAAPCRACPASPEPARAACRAWRVSSGPAPAAPWRAWRASSGPARAAPWRAWRASSGPGRAWSLPAAIQPFAFGSAPAGLPRVSAG